MLLQDWANMVAGKHNTRCKEVCRSWSFTHFLWYCGVHSVTQLVEAIRIVAVKVVKAPPAEL